MAMNFDSGRATALLRLGTGLARATFRSGQEAAIRHVVEGRGRLLVVQKTGWGKSFVYFIATKLLREAGAGPTLLISPLLALMRNQIAAAERMGVRAATINSDNDKDWSDIEQAVRAGEIDILLVSPERLANERFQQAILATVGGHIAMLVVDEAHCISDWGHDFRPHYRLIERTVRTLPRNLRLLATTATANSRVMTDLKTVLGPDLVISRGDLNRPSLALQTILLSTPADRLAWLAEHVPRMQGSGIIYTLTVNDAHRVAGWLKHRGLDVEAYTAGIGETRADLEQALLDNEVKALVATTALGMGFDKPDLSFVIHYQMPGSVVAYYQQVGRGGRALPSAYGILLSGSEERDINDYFIRSAFPTQHEVEEVVAALEAEPEGLTQYELLRAVNISHGRLQKSLLLMSLESPAPVVKDGKRWRLAAARLGDGFWERARRLTELRHEEQRQMQQYVRLDSGHMEFLIRALDGDPSGAAPPTLPPLTPDADPAIADEADLYLRGLELPIARRSRWPNLGLPHYGVSGRITEDQGAEEGRALCLWGDPGWGSLVRRGKYTDEHFSDTLVDAAARLLRRWRPRPKPSWVTCIPSRRRPKLVPDFARRLATRLALPFVAVLDKAEDSAEQKSMANSIQQARNVDGTLAVATPPPEGPVLLIDDMVDSRWTLTVAAWLLRSHGSGPVWPLVLAQTAPDA